MGELNLIAQVEFVSAFDYIAQHKKLKEQINIKGDVNWKVTPFLMHHLTFTIKQNAPLHIQLLGHPL